MCDNSNHKFVPKKTERQFADQPYTENGAKEHSNSENVTEVYCAECGEVKKL